MPSPSLGLIQRFQYIPLYNRRQGLGCDYALTIIDGDVLAHGVPIIRNFDFSCGSGVVYQLPDDDDFPLRGDAAWAFMLGCDYTEGVYGIGPVLAYEVLAVCNGDWSPSVVADAIVATVPAVGKDRVRLGGNIVHGRDRK